jgi:hypothetical protein
MQIIFDSKTLHQSKMGSITAVVYFEFGSEKKFPGVGWNDFVVVVANWWSYELKQIMEGQTKGKFRFMDGPYWIDAVSQQEGLLLRCVEDRRGVGLVYEAVVQMDEFERELRALTRNVSNACKRAGIVSSDLDTLRRSLPN